MAGQSYEGGALPKRVLKALLGEEVHVIFGNGHQIDAVLNGYDSRALVLKGKDGGQTLANMRAVVSLNHMVVESERTRAARKAVPERKCSTPYAFLD